VKTVKFDKKNKEKMAKESKIVGLNKIKPLSFGNGGLELEYDRVAQDKVTYLDSFKATHRKPVSGEFKGLWHGLKKHARGVFRLDEKVEDIDINVIHISKDHDFGYKLKVKVTTAANTGFANECSSCIINEDNYAGFADLELLFDQLEKYIVKYVQNLTDVDTKQVLIDFRAEQISKGKNVDDLEDIESMSDDEKRKKYIEFLEKTGSVFLEYGIKGEA